MVCDLMGQVYEKLGKSPVNIIDQEQFRNQVERLDTLVRVSSLPCTTQTAPISSLLTELHP